VSLILVITHGLDVGVAHLNNRGLQSPPEPLSTGWSALVSHVFILNMKTIQQYQAHPSCLGFVKCWPRERKKIINMECAIEQLAQ
jgi:hypothetical protein